MYEVNPRMACRKREFSVASDVSHSLSVVYPVFRQKIVYESVEGHGASLTARPARLPAAKTSADLRVWMNSLFVTCENAEFLESGGSSRFGALWF
jgi:hypothetical protein